MYIIYCENFYFSVVSFYLKQFLGLSPNKLSRNYFNYLLAHESDNQEQGLLPSPASITIIISSAIFLGMSHARNKANQKTF